MTAKWKREEIGEFGLELVRESLLGGLSFGKECVASVVGGRCYSLVPHDAQPPNGLHVGLGVSSAGPAPFEDLGDMLESSESSRFLVAECNLSVPTDPVLQQVPNVCIGRGEVYRVLLFEGAASIADALMSPGSGYPTNVLVVEQASSPSLALETGDIPRVAQMVTSVVARAFDEDGFVVWVSEAGSSRSSEQDRR
jgi:hypothetical protein